MMKKIDPISKFVFMVFLNLLIAAIVTSIIYIFLRIADFYFINEIEVFSSFRKMIAAICFLLVFSMLILHDFFLTDTKKEIMDAIRKDSISPLE